MAGRRLLGAFGALVDVHLGGGTAAYVFFRVVIQWQARRLLPLIEKETDWAAEFGEAIRAQERVRAVVADDRNRRSRV